MRTRYKVYEDCDHYFVTCAVTKWMPVFTEEKYFETIIESLKHCRSNKGFLLYYYVIMLNHLHMIISTKTRDIPGLVRDFKRHTSKKITKLLKSDSKYWILDIFNKDVSRRKDNIQYKVWQEGYHPKAILSDSILNQKMEYIHLNPVEKGYVSEPEHWKYSSARNIYLGDDSVIELDEIGM